MTKFAMTAALAASLSLFAVAPAAAEEVLVDVSFSDLDVTTQAGADLLGKRITAQAETACARPDIRNLKGMLAFEQCKTDVVASANEQLAAKGVALASAN